MLGFGFTDWRIGLVLSLLSFSSFAHQDEPHGNTNDPAALKPLASEGSSATTDSVAISLVDGWLEAGPEVIRVQRGDTVSLRFTSNTADELHLHGYDLTLALEAGKTHTLKFVAQYAGRFSYELHHAHREIGVIEVMP